MESSNLLIRLNASPPQKYIDLGLAKENEFAAYMCTDDCTHQSRQKTDHITLLDEADLRRRPVIYWRFFVGNLNEILKIFLKFNNFIEILVKNDEV